ncbi:MAG: hypothetical protein WBM98_16035 [Maribacter sp.]|uniref:hypothetical protein n=1 Tax=Maribacter sp. TaxID=1897614 RepID=UPI003C713732
MKRSLSFLMLAFALVLSGCNKDDVAEAVILKSVQYQIYDVSNSGVSGTATFTQEDNGSTHVLIELVGGYTATNPAFIRFNSAAEGGNVAITLHTCECAISNTTITQLDNGNTITYEGLLALNGHVTIHANSSNNSSILAVADIGANSN